MRTAYFDNNATTRVLPSVQAAMIRVLEDGYGNPSALYQRGRQARQIVEDARGAVAALLGCRPDEVIFTSGGTESDNAALFSACPAGSHLVVSAIEHDAVLNACLVLKRQGVQVSVVRPDGNGRLDPEEVGKALRPDTALVSVMTANNETGVIQPVEEIGRLVHDRGIAFHTDAVQAAGKIPVSVRSIGCDLLSLSAHKIHGPQGIGALYLRKGLSFRPLLVGGHQERGRRAGTENLPAIAGFGAAALAAGQGLEDGSITRLAAWRDAIERHLAQQVDGVAINGGSAPRVANTSNLTIKGIPSTALLVALDRQGIALSAGSACRAGSRRPSHVLTAMGLTAADARAAIRISLGKLNSQQDVDDLLEILPRSILELRRNPSAA